MVLPVMTVAEDLSRGPNLVRGEPERRRRQNDDVNQPSRGAGALGQPSVAGGPRSAVQRYQWPRAQSCRTTSARGPGVAGRIACRNTNAATGAVAWQPELSGRGSTRRAGESNSHIAAASGERA